MPNPGNYKDTLTLNSVPAGKYNLEWIDPISGKEKNSENLNRAGGNLQLKTPVYSIDIAMRMNRQS
ncbi:MAG TPA: hypothetical protein DCR40_04975 [Prolixibacteraceae bacterium]|nr:hypothetical protein [Prolixibacteraceae bacterium]